jgi:uncharacterized protein YqeY
VDISQRIEADIKTAMLGGDKPKAETLRGLKTALQYEAVSLGVKDVGLNEEQAQKVLAREAKKRTDTAEIYEKAGEAQRAAAENAEKALIDGYLPAQVSEAEIKDVVSGEIAKIDNPGVANMGQIIAAVRGQLGAQADGGTIARLVKETLSQ